MGYGQLSIFDGTKPLKITKPIRLIELFAGIGSQAKSLERLGADFEHYRVVEFDKYAIASYNAIHGTNFPTLDITQISGADLGIVDTDKYDYVMTYSFPCTDLSKAGKQQGMSRESGTRSGLLWEVERLLKETEHLPQFLLMENVPDVLSEKFIKDFADWVAFLDSLGYTSKWAVINAKEQGVPQNRERCFMLSWLEKDCYYLFPQPKKLTKRLKDVLETEVDEKYYLSDSIINWFTKHSEDMKAKGNVFRFSPIEQDKADTAKAITTRAGSRMDDNFIQEPKMQQVGMLSGGKWDKMHDIARRVYCIDGCSPTIHTMGGGNLEPKIVEPIAYDEQNGYCRQDGCVGTLTTDGSSPKHNNRIIEPIGGSELKRELCNQLLEQGLVEEGDVIRHSYTNSRMQGDMKDIKQKGVCPTLDTRCDCLGVCQEYRIRKLTPKECWRLMDFDDIDFERASKLNSNAQLYKQAGNSIAVACLVEIFRPLLSKEC